MAEGGSVGTAWYREPLVNSKVEKGQFMEYNIWRSSEEMRLEKNWILIWMLKGGTQRIRESAFYTKRGVCLLMDECILLVKGGNCLRNPILLGIRR